jgi:hypothetical protein
MISDFQIPEPVLFNPLKHHLGYIRDFAGTERKGGKEVSDTELIKELKHLGNSVMDVYSGRLGIERIACEVIELLKEGNVLEMESFISWAGIKMEDHRLISLSDRSEWMVKYNDNISRFVHIFPARGSSHSFRVKSNTLKSALLYYMLVGKDYITGDDLNRVRPMLGLSPVKDAADTEAIVEMIEILRNA